MCTVLSGGAREGTHVSGSRASMFKPLYESGSSNRHQGTARVQGWCRWYKADKGGARLWRACDTYYPVGKRKVLNQSTSVFRFMF